MARIGRRGGRAWHDRAIERSQGVLARLLAGALLALVLDLLIGLLADPMPTPMDWTLLAAVPIAVVALVPDAARLLLRADRGARAALTRTLGLLGVYGIARVVDTAVTDVGVASALDVDAALTLLFPVSTTLFALAAVLVLRSRWVDVWIASRVGPAARA